MSVHKNDRNESKFEVLDHAVVLKKMIRELSIIRNFGYKIRESKTPANFDKWSNESKEKWKIREQERIEKLKQLDREFLVGKRAVIESDIEDMMHEITTANSIKFPINLSEMDIRRSNQDKAIAACENLMMDLQDIMDTLPINKNWMTQIQPEIDKEIALLRGWRKSDNPKRRALREKDMHRWLKFIEAHSDSDILKLSFQAFSDAMERCETDEESESIQP